MFFIKKIIIFSYLTLSRTMTTTDIYARAVTKLREISTLSSIGGLLGWDEMVMLPEGSSGLRSKQKSVLTGMIFDLETSPTLGELLRSLDASKDQLTVVQRAVVRDSLKSFVRSTALPKSLVQRQAELETEGYNTWVAARQASDFAPFGAVLQEWVELNKQKAAFIDPSKDAYDVLLDMYEKGMTQGSLQYFLPFLARSFALSLILSFSLVYLSLTLFLSYIPSISYHPHHLSLPSIRASGYHLHRSKERFDPSNPNDQIKRHPSR